MMLIKSLTWHSLTYLVGISSSMMVHQVIPRGAAGEFQSDPSAKAAIITDQIVARQRKSDRLPIKQAKPRANNRAPGEVPVRIEQNPKITVDCKPIDVPGRCFAGLWTNRTS